jgi:hypothetical protein
MKAEWEGPLGPLRADALIADIGEGERDVPVLIRSGMDCRYEGAGLADLALPRDAVVEQLRGLRLSDKWPTLQEIATETLIGDLALDLPEVTRLGGPSFVAHSDGALTAWVQPGFRVVLGPDLEILEVKEGQAVPPAGELSAEIGDRTIEVRSDAVSFHRLFLRRANGRIEGVSPGFRFTRAGKEEATGIAVAGDRLVLGFGVAGHAAIAVCSLDAAMSLFRASPPPGD